VTRVPSGTLLLLPVTNALNVAVANTEMDGVGFVVRTMLSGGAEAIVIVVKAVPGVVPALTTGGPANEAVTFTGVTNPFDVNVIEARPEPSVTADKAERVTTPGLSTEKFIV